MDIYCQFGWSFGVCSPLVGGTMWVFSYSSGLHVSAFAAHMISHIFLPICFLWFFYDKGFHCEYHLVSSFVPPSTMCFSLCSRCRRPIPPSCLVSHKITAQRGQMRMNSTTVSTWDVMEVNSVFGIGYFKPMGPTRGGGWSDQSNR